MVCYMVWVYGTGMGLYGMGVVWYFIIWLNRILKRDWSVPSQYKVVLRS